VSKLKQRKEIDKAIAHLRQFQEENAPWDALMDEFLSQMFAPLAKRLAISVEDAEAQIMDGDYGFMAYGYLFEEFATARRDGAPRNMIDEYLQQRGWREGTHGRRYLRTLSESDLDLWEVVDCRPGVCVDVRRFGTQDKPTRVKEQSASEGLRPWDCIAARVCRFESHPMFAGGMLVFTPSQAGMMQRTLANLGKELKVLLKTAQTAGDLEELPENLDEYINLEMRDKLAEVAFTVWCTNVLDAQDRPFPQMFNMDDEPIEVRRQRFPIIGDREALRHSLGSSPVLSEGEEGCWAWYPKPVGEIAQDERVSIHGHLWLKDKSLELETNSANRAERGKALLQALAGDHLGEPLTIHENLERALQEHAGSEESDDDFNASPEVQAVLQAHLTAHYRKTLDETIPMLNGKTPRACAANPQTRHEVIEWLKYLENMSARSPNSDYDFSWMWQELGLDRE